jgi:hypothetical protein
VPIGIHKEKHMTKIHGSIGVCLAAAFLIAALGGCEKKEGPAERAGKAVDNAVENAGRQVEKAGEKIQETAKDAKK